MFTSNLDRFREEIQKNRKKTPQKIVYQSDHNLEQEERSFGNSCLQDFDILGLLHCARQTQLTCHGTAVENLKRAFGKEVLVSL